MKVLVLVVTRMLDGNNNSSALLNEAPNANVNNYIVLNKCYFYVTVCSVLSIACKNTLAITWPMKFVRWILEANDWQLEVDRECGLCSTM